MNSREILLKITTSEYLGIYCAPFEEDTTIIVMSEGDANKIMNRFSKHMKIDYSERYDDPECLNLVVPNNQFGNIIAELIIFRIEIIQKRYKKWYQRKKLLKYNAAIPFYKMYKISGSLKIKKCCFCGFMSIPAYKIAASENIIIPEKPNYYVCNCFTYSPEIVCMDCKQIIHFNHSNLFHADFPALNVFTYCANCWKLNKPFRIGDFAKLNAEYSNNIINEMELNAESWFDTTWNLENLLK